MGKPVEVEITPNPNALAEIVALARRQVELEDLVADATIALSDLKEMLRQVAQEDLPLAMKEVGLVEFTLDNGDKILIKDDYDVGIKVENREAAFKWVEDHGYSSIIKTEVTTSFGKDELETAIALQAALTKKKLNVVLTRDIHWQTLKAFIKERVQSITKKTPKKDRIPLDLFGAMAVNKAVVKSPKAKKAKKAGSAVTEE